MLPLLLALAVGGSQQAYVVTLFQPAIEVAPNLGYEIWKEGPSIDELRIVAEHQRRDGEAALRCSVTQDGRLKHCKVVNQLGSRSFGSAALRLSARFQLKPDLVERALAANAMVFIELPFCARNVCNPPEWPGYKP